MKVIGKDSPRAVSAQFYLSAADPSLAAVAGVAIRADRANTARDSRRSSWGSCREGTRGATGPHKVPLAARGERRRGKSVGPAAETDRRRAAGLAVRDLDDDHDRHGPGAEEISAAHDVLLSAGFLLGGQDGHAAPAAGRAGAGGTGTLAQPDPRRQETRRQGRGHQRSAGRKEFSRLSAHSPVGGRLAAADRPAGRAGRDLRRAVPPARRAARDDSRHRLDEIRRCTDRPRQPGDPAAGRAGRFLAQRHRAPGRQHAGAGRGDGTGDVSRAQSQVAPVAIGACACVIPTVSKPWQGLWTRPA